MIKRFQPKSIPHSSSPFSQVVLDDRYVYLSGLVAADFPQGIDVLGDVGLETQAVLTAVTKILEELHLTTEDVVRVDVHLSDLNDFDDMNVAYTPFFRQNRYPSRTTTESPRLFGGSKVEITIQAKLRT